MLWQICVGVTITTPSIVQSVLVNLVPVYSRTMFGNFGRFSNTNIFDAWLELHIQHICPYGTRPGLQESVDQFSTSAIILPLGGAKRITLTSYLRHLLYDFRCLTSQTYGSCNRLSKIRVEVKVLRVKNGPTKSDE